MRLKKSTLPAPDVFLKDIPSENQDVVRSRLTSLADLFATGVMNWGFEVVKHLAIFNGAGLAGATALLQRAGTNDLTKTATVLSMHLFVYGLIAGIVAMLAIYLTGVFLHGRFQRTTIDVLLNKQPIGAMKPRRIFWILIGVNWLCAAVSIALFFWGALTIAGLG